MCFRCLVWNMVVTLLSTNRPESVVWEEKRYVGQVTSEHLNLADMNRKGELAVKEQQNRLEIGGLSAVVN